MIRLFGDQGGYGRGELDLDLDKHGAPVNSTRSLLEYITSYGLSPCIRLGPTYYSVAARKRSIE